MLLLLGAAGDDGSREDLGAGDERTAGADAVIAKGLQPGEVVVTEGQLRLAPGSRVILPGEAGRGGGGAGRR